MPFNCGNVSFWCRLQALGIHRTMYSKTLYQVPFSDVEKRGRGHCEILRLRVALTCLFAFARHADQLVIKQSIDFTPFTLWVTSLQSIIDLALSWCGLWYVESSGISITQGFTDLLLKGAPNRGSSGKMLIAIICQHIITSVQTVGACTGGLGMLMLPGIRVEWF